MLVVVCADRGSPGATTTALALGVAASGPSVVVEADPYGGDLGLRCRVRGGGALPETPTVLTAATAARTSTGGGLLTRYSHEFTPGTRVVPGHLAAEQAATVGDWTPLARTLAATEGTVVADVGRIHAASPTVPVAAAADVLVAVTRADVAAVVHLRARLHRLLPALAKIRGRPPVVVPVVIAPRRHHRHLVVALAEQLAGTAAGPVVREVAALAWDPAGVEQLETGHVTGRDARTPLLRTAHQVLLTALQPPGDAPTRAGSWPAARWQDRMTGARNQEAAR